MSSTPPSKRGLIEVRSHSKHEEEGEGNWLVSYADMMTLLVGFFIILQSFSSIDSGKFEEMRKAVTQQFGGTYQIPFKDMANRLRATLEKLGVGDQTVIKQDESGVEISFLGTVFFNTGSADIKAESLDLLRKLIPEIKKEGEEFNVTVEGHTDNIPIHHAQGFHNNWELSSVRACRVIAEFEDAGFAVKRLTAVGYGDTRPLLPNQDENGQPLIKNQAQNRRVVIKLLKAEPPALGPSSESAAQVK